MAMVSQSGPTMPAMYCSGLTANSRARPPSTALVSRASARRRRAAALRRRRRGQSGRRPHSHGMVPIQCPKKAAVSGTSSPGRRHRTRTPWSARNRGSARPTPAAGRRRRCPAAGSSGRAAGRADGAARRRRPPAAAPRHGRGVEDQDLRSHLRQSVGDGDGVAGDVVFVDGAGQWCWRRSSRSRRRRRRSRRTASRGGATSRLSDAAVGRRDSGGWSRGLLS